MCGVTLIITTSDFRTIQDILYVMLTFFNLGGFHSFLWKTRQEVVNWDITDYLNNVFADICFIILIINPHVLRPSVHIIIFSICGH